MIILQPMAGKKWLRSQSRCLTETGSCFKQPLSLVQPCAWKTTCCWKLKHSSHDANENNLHVRSLYSLSAFSVAVLTCPKNNLFFFFLNIFLKRQHFFWQHRDRRTLTAASLQNLLGRLNVTIATRSLWSGTSTSIPTLNQVLFSHSEQHGPWAHGSTGQLEPFPVPGSFFSQWQTNGIPIRETHSLQSYTASTSTSRLQWLKWVRTVLLSC